MTNQSSRATSTLNGYKPLISEATGETDFLKLEAIEDCMRNVICHSTLDWQTADQLKQAAREAVEIIRLADIQPDAPNV